MPQFACTAFFQDVAHGYGWSETYFIAKPDPLGIQAARTAFDVLIAARLEVLTDIHEVSAGRVSDVAILNDSLLVAGLPLPGQVVSTVVTACEPWTCLNVRMEAGPEFRGRKFFHGILETTFQDNRNYAPANPQAAEWTALFTLLEDEWDLRVEHPLLTHYESITKCIPRRQTTRKVGRPFDLLVGRHRT